MRSRVRLIINLSDWFQSIEDLISAHSSIWLKIATQEYFRPMTPYDINEGVVWKKHADIPLRYLPILCLIRNLHLISVDFSTIWTIEIMIMIILFHTLLRISHKTFQLTVTTISGFCALAMRIPWCMYQWQTYAELPMILCTPLEYTKTS